MRRRMLAALAMLAAPLLLALGMRVDAHGATLLGVAGPACPVGGLLGEPACPGCGLVRSTALVLQGQWAEAALLHLGGFVVVALCAAGLLVYGHALWRGRVGPAHRRLLASGRAVFVAGLLLAWSVKLLWGNG